MIKLIYFPPSTEHRAPSTELRLHYQSYGSGFPLIILHGFLGAGGNWHTLSRNVFGEHFQVFAVDQRNHGKSPHGEPFDYPTLAADLEAFMDDLELPSAHVLGHSMGGKTAMQFALSYPDRVEKLVVADIAPRPYPLHHTPILEALRRLDLKALGSRQAIDEALAQDIEELGVRQFLLKNLMADKERGYTWKMNLDVLYETYPKVAEAVDGWPAFSRPTLFIHGGASGYVSDADQPDIERLFTDFEMIELPGVGHWLHAEAPTPFASAVMDFLLDE